MKVQTLGGKGMSYVKDEYDLASLIQTKLSFSNAIAVVDTTDGWHEEGRNEGGDRHDRSQIGGRLAAR